jgi:hypothetical protein
MHELIKISSSQLSRLPDDQIVKVAGVLRRLKNWLKTQFSPEFKEEVEKLETESVEYSSTLDEIKQQIEKVQDAIKDKELEEYRSELKVLKELLDKTLIKTDKNLDQAGIVSSVTGRVKSFRSLTSEIVNEYEKLMEEHNYDLPLKKSINIKFSDSNYYKNLNYNNFSITITPSAQGALKEKLNTAINGSLNISLEDIENKINEEFYNRLAKAILNGTIGYVAYQVPSQGKSATIGHLLLSVLSDDFIIPDTNIKIKADVVLIDPTLANDKRFILRKTDVIKVVSGSSGSLSSISEARKNFYSKIIKHALSSESNIKAKRVDIKNTLNPHSPDEVAEMLKDAYQNFFGELPSLETLAFMWAQLTWEHGRKYKFIGNNVGNLKAFDSWLSDSSNMYYAMDTKEYTQEGKEYVEKSAKWRAYPTLEKGFEAYLERLKNKFPKSLEKIQEGKPVAASETLSKEKYYTAPVEQYTGNVKSIYDEFLKKYSDKFPELSRVSSQKEDSKFSAPGSSEQSVSKIDELSKTLYASPLTYLVKNAIFKINNPEKKILIQVEGSDLTDNLEYANNLSYLIQDYLKGVTTLHKLDNKIQIQAIAHTESNFKLAAIELSNLLSKEINKKINKNVYTVIAENLPTFADEISDEEIESNHRKFLMRNS